MLSREYTDTSKFLSFTTRTRTLDTIPISHLTSPQPERRSPLPRPRRHLQRRSHHAPAQILRAGERKSTRAQAEEDARAQDGDPAHGHPRTQVCRQQIGKGPGVVVGRLGVWHLWFWLFYTGVWLNRDVVEVDGPREEVGVCAAWYAVLRVFDTPFVDFSFLCILHLLGILVSFAPEGRESSSRLCGMFLG